MSVITTVAVAESLTCGALQNFIGRISGASKYFQGGMTCYNLEQKVCHLNVNEEHAYGVDCVSERVAREMAKNVARKFGSDIGMATTGYASPVAYSGLYAWIAVYDRRRDVLVSIKVSAPEKTPRNIFQEYVARSVVELFLVNFQSFNSDDSFTYQHLKKCSAHSKELLKNFWEELKIIL